MGRTDRANGDAFYEMLADQVVVDHDGWAYDVTHRVAERLQADVPPDERLEPVVAWLEEQNAFTLPGRYVYFSRHLLQRGLTEDGVAFVFAHELAHHRLGHLQTWLADVPMAWAVGLLAHVIERAVVSPEREIDADRWALERCIAAGYDRGRCIDAFRVLERLAIDAGDVDAVYGAEDPEQLAEARLGGEAPGQLDELLAEGRRWLWQRRRRYLSIRDRRAALERLPAAGSLVGAWRRFTSKAS